MYNTDNDELKKLNYLQTKIHETLLDCINTYSLASQKNSLFYSFSGLVFMRFRDSIDTSVANPSRLKANSSVIDNIEKEILKKIRNNLPTDYNYEDIDNLSSQIVKDVCKDYLGATIIFHSKNNCSKYCEESDRLLLRRPGLHPGHRPVCLHPGAGGGIGHDPIQRFHGAADRKGYSAAVGRHAMKNRGAASAPRFFVGHQPSR